MFSGAQVDKCAVCRQLRCDVVLVKRKDLSLVTRGLVLIEQRDGIEQVGAQGVVEEGG